MGKTDRDDHRLQGARDRDEKVGETDRARVGDGDKDDKSLKMDRDDRGAMKGHRDDKLGRDRSLMPNRDDRSVKRDVSEYRAARSTKWPLIESLLVRSRPRSF
jgi:hypothetical protein